MNMVRVRLMAVMLFIVGLSRITVFGQVTEPSSSATGRLEITSTPVSGDVMVDSTWVGRTPVTVDGVVPGGRVIRVFTPSAASWNRSEAIDTVEVTGGAIVVRHYVVDRPVRFMSIPSGATVTRQNVPLGVTPFDLRGFLSVEERFVVQKEGFEPSSVVVPAGRSISLVRLREAHSPGVPTQGDLLRRDDVEPTAEGWETLAAAGAMVVSGFIAAYAKDRADRDFALYLNHRNPSTLASTQRYDRISAAALISAQVSFGVLAYVLLQD